MAKRSPSESSGWVWEVLLTDLSPMLALQGTLFTEMESRDEKAPSMITEGWLIVAARISYGWQ